MNSNLLKVNQPKCLKSKQESKFSLHLVILLKQLTIILRKIGQEISSSEIDPLACVNPVDG